MLQERWPLWKAGLYDLGVVLLQGHYFQTDGLAYDNSRAMDLVMSLEFTKKQGFKLKKIERLIYVRKVNGFFSKEGLIEYMVEVNIYY